MRWHNAHLVWIYTGCGRWLVGMHRSVSVEGFQLRHGITDKFFHLVTKLTIDYHMQQLWQGLAEELLCKKISQLLKAYEVVWGCFIWIQGELIFAVNFRLVPCIHGMDGLLYKLFLLFSVSLSTIILMFPLLLIYIEYGNLTPGIWTPTL